MPIISDKDTVLQLAAVIQKTTGHDSRQSAEAALRQHYRLASCDGIYGGSEAAICMGWTSASEDDDLIEQIITEVELELDTVSEQSKSRERA